MKATAIAHPNIAVVKYWGKRNVTLNLPAVPSISVTLDQFITETTVEWGAHRDILILNGKENTAVAQRVFRFLNQFDPNRPYCRVKTQNNFPTAAGLASSASAFAALTLAATKAAQKDLTIQQQSTIARMGSGSACRSLWGGWVEWKMGERQDGLDSHGVPLAAQDHWDIRIIVVVLQDGPKPIPR